jgi:hypothetical protein
MIWAAFFCFLLKIRARSSAVEGAVVWFVDVKKFAVVFEEKKKQVLIAICGK